MSRSPVNKDNQPSGPSILSVDLVDKMIKTLENWPSLPALVPVGRYRKFMISVAHVMREMADALIEQDRRFVEAGLVVRSVFPGSIESPTEWDQFGPVTRSKRSPIFEGCCKAEPTVDGLFPGDPGYVRPT